MPVNIRLKKDAIQILNEILQMKEIVGELENWSHNIKKDFYGQAARNMQALIQKFARTIDSIVELPRTKNKLSYLKSDLTYLICEILGEKDISNYTILYDTNDKRTTLNTEANLSKHNLTESRFCAKECAKVFNSIVDRIQRLLRIDKISKFKVEVKYIKNINAPTSNYFYLEPIEGEADYIEKKKRQDRLFELFKKTLVSPEDYYIQFKAIKYQRDTILKEELDSKWNQIRKDHLDHTREFEYIIKAIGDHTKKINYLISQLIYDNVKYNKCLSLAKQFLLEEIERNNKIINYTNYVIDGVNSGEGHLIQANGVITRETSRLSNYIIHKEEQNDRLKEKLTIVNNRILTSR